VPTGSRGAIFDVNYYGPRGTASTAGDNIMKPALRGKRARWLGSLDQPHTLNYLEDMARALVTLGERDEADGQVWHLPSAEPLTGRQFLGLVFEAAGHPPKIGVASRSMIRIAGLFNPFLRELGETLYQFERPFVSDASKFQGAFGPFEPTPHPEGESHGGLVPLPVRRRALIRRERGRGRGARQAQTSAWAGRARGCLGPSLHSAARTRTRSSAAVSRVARRCPRECLRGGVPRQPREARSVLQPRGWTTRSSSRRGRGGSSFSARARSPRAR
jgi:hypothetical protein